MTRRSWKGLLGLCLATGLGGAVVVEHYLRDWQMRPELWMYRDKPGDLSAEQLSNGSVGVPAADFTLPKLQQNGEIHLADLWSRKPVVILFGSFSCDIFDEHIQNLQALADIYGDQVEFLIVIGHEAGHRNVPVAFLYEQADLQHETSKERLQRSCRAAGYLHISMNIVGDREDRSAERAYQGFPMRLVVIERGGTIILNAGKETPTVRNLNQFGYWLKNYLAGFSAASK